MWCQIELRMVHWFICSQGCERSLVWQRRQCRRRDWTSANGAAFVPPELCSPILEPNLWWKIDVINLYGNCCNEHCLLGPLLHLNPLYWRAPLSQKHLGNVFVQILFLGRLIVHWWMSYDCAAVFSLNLMSLIIVNDVRCHNEDGGYLRKNLKWITYLTNICKVVFANVIIANCYMILICIAFNWRRQIEKSFKLYLDLGILHAHQIKPFSIRLLLDETGS